MGRPTRREASAKALVDVDLTLVDPVKVLQSIAADTGAPAAARVAACRLLIEYDRSGGEPETEPDAVSRHALTILRGGKDD